MVTIYKLYLLKIRSNCNLKSTCILKNQFQIKMFYRGALILKPKYLQMKGDFFESWNQDEFNEIVRKYNFCQDNHSCSSFAVLRGLHFQVPPKAQGKLVRCTYGAIFDVAVDIRINSTTFGQWIGIDLTAENKNQFWIPKFAQDFDSI